MRFVIALVAFFLALTFFAFDVLFAVVVAQHMIQEGMAIIGTSIVRDWPSWTAAAVSFVFGLGFFCAGLSRCAKSDSRYDPRACLGGIVNRMKRFQIGVREFLVLTALVAVILGWARDHGVLVAERDELRMRVGALESHNESQHSQIQRLQAKNFSATR